MPIIKIILLLFFIFAIVKVIARYRGHELSWRGAFVWILFWFIAGVVAIEPNSTFYLAHFVGVTRGADLVVYMALVGLFFIIFRFMLKFEHLNREITVLTRKISLMEANRQTEANRQIVN